ncbi:hypothetical protein BFP46_24740 [Bacillus licheniformis]|nr:hypothetical protein BFP46_24740 [Bacillus licheniformis]
MERGFKNRQPKGMLIFLWGSGRLSPTGSDGVRGFRKKNRRFFSALFPISGADQKERRRLSQPSAEPALYGVKYSGLYFTRKCRREKVARRGGRERTTSPKKRWRCFMLEG